MKYRNAIKFKVVPAGYAGEEMWAIVCVFDNSKLGRFIYRNKGDAIRECKKWNRVVPASVKREMRDINARRKKLMDAYNSVKTRIAEAE